MVELNERLLKKIKEAEKDLNEKNCAQTNIIDLDLSETNEMMDYISSNYRDCSAERRSIVKDNKNPRKYFLAVYILKK